MVGVQDPMDSDTQVNIGYIRNPYKQWFCPGYWGDLCGYVE